MIEKGWHGVGIEPNATMAGHACRELGLDVDVGSLEDFPSSLDPFRMTKDGRFDLVNWIQVLPHFVDPLMAMAKAADLTRDGGYWLIETWDCSSRVAKMAGPHWHEYSPPSVLHWFTPASVAAMAGEYGFRQVAKGRPKKRISVGHARSLMREKLRESVIGSPLLTLSRLLPDSLTLPYPSFDLFWILLRKES